MHIDYLTKIDLDISDRDYGVAGEYAYKVTATYHFNDGTSQKARIAFKSSIYGAPVVMVNGAGSTFVDDWKQYGDKLDPAWIRRYFG